MMTKDKITKESLKDYRKITQNAFDIVKKNIIKNKKDEAKKILEMVGCYLSDSKYFEKQDDLINSFGAIYYAHGWIDCGVKLGIFDVHDDKLFTVRD